MSWCAPSSIEVTGDRTGLARRLPLPSRRCRNSRNPLPSSLSVHASSLEDAPAAQARSRDLSFSSPLWQSRGVEASLPRPCALPRASFSPAAALSRVQDDPALDDVAECVLETAEQLALEAGALIRKKLGRPNQVLSKEVRSDLVTEVDRECEELISKTVRSAFPLHAIVGEESATAEGLGLLEGQGGAMGPTDWTWIIDPIDGTLNFVGGIPFCAVSIGVARGGVVEVGVVYDPFANEMFSARRGEGAFLNGRTLPKTSSPEPLTLELEDAAVAVGFPSHQADRDRLVRAMAAVAPHTRTMRALGSAALHMSYVAMGRLGCFFEPALKAWDIAAAKLIVEECRGTVTSMEGTAVPLSGGSVLASRGGEALHSRVLSLIRSSEQ